MKQKDVITLIVVAFISLVISVVAARLLFSPSRNQQAVEVVPVISANFPAPSSQFFNSNAIDPTQLIQIGNTNNPTPFNNSQQ
jgi:hypothetical protein